MPPKTIPARSMHADNYVFCISLCIGGSKVAVIRLETVCCHHLVTSVSVLVAAR